MSLCRCPADHIHPLQGQRQKASSENCLRGGITPPALDCLCFGREGFIGYLRERSLLPLHSRQRA